jgi:hypothetical protein
MCLPLLDSPNENIVMYFKQANEFIEKALNENEEDKIKNRVLVHW